MNYLLAESLSKSFGVRELFSNLTFGIQKGQKVALVARNGSGKSTLLKILAGEEPPDSGKVVLRNGLVRGYLEQSPSLDPEKSVIECMLTQDDPSMHAIRAYEQALIRYEKTGLEADYTQLTSCIQKMDQLMAWDIESKIKQVLHQLKIYDFDAKISTLSGGQVRRVSLATLLIRMPDILLLDEPTNHLDVDMIEWLENYLSSADTTLLMVTHDRYFLDNVCTDIYELDRSTLFSYHGDYAYFMEKKAEREMAYQSETDKARNLYYRELEWIRKMPKARGTKSKSRVDAFEDITNKAFRMRKEKELQINMRMTRMGNKIVELIKISKSYGEKKLIQRFSYSFRKGERIGIVGSNGTGKTTFLKILTGELKPDEGKIIIGDTIEFGYYRQQGISLKEDKRVIEVIKDIAEVIDVDKSAKVTASQMLTKFDFPPDMQYTPVSKLSGGEKRRLYLLTVLLKNPNFLIIDEPTNDLDIMTLTKLEEYLMTYQGCMIIVSHDRYFMDKLSDQIFIFKGDGEIDVFSGTYSEYRIKQQADTKKASEKEELKEPSEIKAEKKKLSYKEKLEFEQIEIELPKLEQEKVALEKALSEVHTDHEKLLQLTELLSDLIHRIDEKTDRWLHLSQWGS